jgi:hypothetical protein
MGTCYFVHIRISLMEPTFGSKKKKKGNHVTLLTFCLLSLDSPIMLPLYSNTRNVASRES